MKSLILAGACALALSGCALFQSAEDADPAREVIAGCGAIAGALNVLTPNKAKLSEGQIAIVNNVVDVSEPICTAEAPPENAVALVERMALQLTQIQIAIIGGE